MRTLALSLAVFASFMLAACSDVIAPDGPMDTPSNTAVNVSSDTQCRVTAWGTIEAGDRFAGETIGGTEEAVGHWIVLTPAGNRFLGVPDRIVCELNGTLLVTIQGTGSFDGQSGLLFQLVFQDRQDPDLVDTFRIVIKTPEDELVYSVAGLVSGDVITMLGP